MAEGPFLFVSPAGMPERRRLYLKGQDLYGNLMSQKGFWLMQLIMNRGHYLREMF